MQYTVYPKRLFAGCIDPWANGLRREPMVLACEASEALLQRRGSCGVCDVCTGKLSSQRACTRGSDSALRLPVARAHHRSLNQESHHKVSGIWLFLCSILQRSSEARAASRRNDNMNMDTPLQRRAVSARVLRPSQPCKGTLAERPYCSQLAAVSIRTHPLLWQRSSTRLSRERQATCTLNPDQCWMI